MPLLNNEKRSCCRFEIIDKSEYIVIPSIFIALGGFVFAIVAGPTGMAVATGVVAVSGMVAEWRIRALGVAKKLMDSVRDLKDENERLKLTNLEFEADLVKFEDMIGLLGDNVGDLEVAKNQLFELYQKYKDENDRQESNNLLTLFGLVDKNEDSKLSQQEIKRMKEYIRIVYKEEFDFDSLDSDDDGFVSLEEFFQKFRNRKIKSETQVIKRTLSRRNAAPTPNPLGTNHPKIDIV